jgi:hypothetical protein
MNKIKESKSMVEVWKWKEEAYKEVEHLDTKSAALKRLKDSAETVKNIKIKFRNVKK